MRYNEIAQRWLEWWKSHTDEATKEKAKRTELLDLVAYLVDSNVYADSRPVGELFWGEGNVNADIVFAGMRPSQIELLLEPGPLREQWQEMCRGLNIPCTTKDAYFTSMLKHERLHFGPEVWERLRQSFDAEIALLAPKVVIAMGDWGGLSVFPNMSLAASGGRMKVERLGLAPVTFIASDHPALLLGTSPYRTAMIKSPLERAAEVLHGEGAL